jgi:hypothetical protein
LEERLFPAIPQGRHPAKSAHYFMIYVFFVKIPQMDKKSQNPYFFSYPLGQKRIQLTQKTDIQHINTNKKQAHHVSNLKTMTLE